MYPSFPGAGGNGRHTRLSLLAGPTTQDAAGVTPAKGHVVHDVSIIGEPRERSDDPDVAICKLSLTFDEAKRPRPRKGPFGYDFEPFM